MRCDKCKYWAPPLKIYKEPIIGECTGMRRNDRVYFEIRAGWDGGYLSEIVTDCDFFCAEFEEKE